MHTCIDRAKLYTLTAVSIAACTCALGLPSSVFAETQTRSAAATEKSAASADPAAPVPSSIPAPATAPVAATTHATPTNNPVYDTAANYKKVSEDDSLIEYTYENNPKKITNPFPDIISDNDIEKAFKNKEVSVEKIYFKPAATSDNPHPKSELVKNRFLKNVDGEYIVYKVYKNFPNDNSAQITSNCGISINGSIAKDGSIYAGSKPTVTVSYEPFTFELNGYKIADNSKKTIDIKCTNSSFKNYLYLKLTYEYKFNSEIFKFLHNYCYQGECDNYSWIFNRYFSAADAQFHFVDDLQYRALNPGGVNADGSLKQRGNSDTHPSLTDEDKKKGILISSVPLHKIVGLTDISGASTVTTDEAAFYRNDSGDLKTPILSFKDDPKAKDIKRPTLADLTGKNIPGYVYWDNDIDKPQNKNHEFANDGATKETPGSHYLSFAYEMKDGQPVKRLTRKHYYVTFRPIPTQLVVQYKNNDGSYKDASYSLLNANNSQVTGGFKASTANIAVPQKPALETMIKSKDTALLSAGAGYVSEGLAYLAPGSYTVAPLADAPEGYEWVVASAQTAGTTGSAPTQAAAKEERIIAPVHKDDTSALQQVVTFVLRKKIAPPPQPGPYPLPEPVPVPDVPAPAPLPAPTPEPEHKVPAIEAPAPTAPADAPAPIVRKRPRALPQTSDPMTISAVGELSMILGAAAGSLAAALRRKRLWKRD